MMLIKSPIVRWRVKVGAWIFVLLFIVSYVGLSYAVGGPAREQVRDAYYTVIGGAMIAGFAVASLVIRGVDKWVWRFLTLTGLFWAAGDIVHRSYEVYGIFRTPVETLASYSFYFIAYAALTGVFYGLAKTIDQEREYLAKIARYIMALVFSAPVVAYISLLGIAPFSLSEYIERVMPVIDVGILLGILYIFFTRKPQGWMASYEYIMFGLGLFTVADIGFSIFKPAGIFDLMNFPTLAVMILWMFGYCLLFLAVVYRLTEPSGEAAP